MLQLQSMSSALNEEDLIDLSDLFGFVLVEDFLSLHEHMAEHM